MIFGRHVNKYYIRYGLWLIFGAFFLILVDFLQLKIPELYSMVVDGMNMGMVKIDGVMTPFTMDILLDKICLPMIFVIFFLLIGRFAWRVCFFGTGIRVETDLREKMFDHSKKLPQEYYQKNKVGNLMALFTNDLETIQECFSNGLLASVDAVTLGILSLSKMFSMDKVLTAFMLIPMALMLSIGLIVGKYLKLKWNRRQECFSELSDFTQENFSGIAVIKAFVKEFKELIAFRHINKDNEEANVAYTKLSSLLNISVTLLIESVICIILGYGSYLVKTNVFTAGQLIEFIGYFTAIIWPVMAITEIIDMTARGRASLSRISELLDAEESVKDGENLEAVPALSGEIEFKNLTFTYPDADYSSLKNVSFKIEAGENVGIVGKTGCGKTTLVDLLLRTYNLPDGTLFLDGHDINKLPIKTVRENMAYVPQDNFLFSDTVENNIAFASVEYNDEVNHDSVEKAAVMANIHDNITSFSEGYQTVLGERGVTVSGGQKQRISIARALMKQAPILILDDSVSAVDTKTEKSILEHLKRSRAGMTTLLIAHRISTVEQMDKILFLDEGKVVDFGTHRELLERCPEYKTMVDLQKIDKEMEEHNNA